MPTDSPLTSADAQDPTDVKRVGRAYHQRRNVRFIVDSTADYAPGVTDALGVEVIPFTYMTPEGEQVDDLWATSDPHEFYEAMRKNPTVHYTTSAVTPGRYYEARHWTACPRCTSASPADSPPRSTPHVRRRR